MPTLEKASRCPKCDKPGTEVSNIPAFKEGQNRGKVLTYQCVTPLCTWFQTGWAVHILPDNTIPERKLGPKEYPELTSYAESVARSQIEELSLSDPNAAKYLKDSDHTLEQN
jgi:hypothetical protein